MTALPGAQGKLYSIWLMPPQDSGVAQRLKEEIRTLQQQASGAAFEPHVTLLGGLETTEANVLDATKTLAASLQARAQFQGCVEQIACDAHAHYNLCRT